MGLFDSVLGMVPNLLGTQLGNMHAEEMQNDTQAFNESMQNNAQNFNSAQAVAQRDWTERMSSTAYQRATSDMKAAGLNPMLAYQQGGSHTGSGASATSSGASSGTATPVHANLSAGMQSAAQVDLLNAQTSKTNAEEEQIRKTTKDLMPVTIEKMRQEITESVERITKIMEEVKNIGQQTTTSAAQAALFRQHTYNLEETVANIKETVNLLKAQVHETFTRAGKEAALDMETRQKIFQNLPELEAALHKVELMRKQFDQPRQSMDSQANASWIGALGALLRAFNPFTQIIGPAK